MELGIKYQNEQCQFLEWVSPPISFGIQGSVFTMPTIQGIYVLYYRWPKYLLLQTPKTLRSGQSNENGMSET